MSGRRILASAAVAAALFASVITAISLLPPEAPGVSYRVMDFTNLPGWREDDHAAALEALKESCRVWRLQDPARSVSSGPLAGTIGEWANVCQGAVASRSGADARPFFEASFTPVQIIKGENSRGLLTGYYEPFLRGSLSFGPDYSIPLYRRPPELVTVDLGAFRPDLSGRRIAGQVRNGRLFPFPGRAEIEAGALEGRGLELLWVSDAVDAFFLQIQGSGRVMLEDGTIARVGYDGPNGQPYTSLGRVMAEKGLLKKQEISLQTIRAWLRDNPAEGRILMQQNAAFTFFRLLESPGPIGSGGFVLTPGRSLAVDRRFIPLGAPVWISGTRPDEQDPAGEPVEFQRLLIAQDTGGAINGPLRGDIFWGFGERAEILAGHMAHYAEFYILLPKAIALRFEDNADAAEAE